MALEIERKFLVTGDAWRREATEIRHIRQGYLAVEQACAVRARLIGDRAWLTIKGQVINGVTQEFEYAIPASDAATMLDILAKRPLIEKVRHSIPHAGLVWEVDEFFGDNAGLIIAEVELDTPDQDVTLPAWVGREVTGEARYYNASLVTNPFCRW